MGNNMVNYKWQTKQSVNVDTLYRGYNTDKRNRKLLSKKLNALQTNPSRWIHEMDDDMLESVCMMLDSDDNTNRSMAKDIIFKSKLNYNQIRHLVNKYCHTLLYESSEPITYYDAG